MLYDFIKRILDIVLSLILVILFSPLIALTIIAIKLDSEGPILADTPHRVGSNGKLFKMYKFRSMVKNAHKILTNDPQFRKLYEEYRRGSYKLKYDPRITGVGKIIRKYSIDEVPQFINVFTGAMSIVGPRAYYPDELAVKQK